ncbi:3-deoxy-D-manno-octulosonate 8-phosphate phosphatase [Desulfopila sp. IMCC35006]|uniref:KdsC family phosphatase n=1 Tax=Desulfopila sp. IMCC35006 TaxID=2569542 RepID=UPI0010AB635B|nr:HAD hydrolase family protein [Desulfopila sp. IMCC35006]TKB26258.1 3-deoxy-D-manno-octulosonate 8-phosphate phosphatase [Desulfopila sp. IMCC35006]
MADNCPPSPTDYPSDCEILEGYRTRVRERDSRKNDPQRVRALAKAREIKLLLLDVDGVLTDGTLLYTGSGEESKSFNTQDGFGLRLLGEAGVDTGVITARQSEVVARRTKELNMRFIYQGVGNKNDAFREIMRVSGLKPFQIAYMGDDWLDLVLLQQVGLAIAPANAVPEVQEIVHFITERPGGGGAVRDACDLLVEAKNLALELLQKYKNR